ncbi:hypothetical protein [Streptomyces sp. NPDC003374]
MVSFSHTVVLEPVPRPWLVGALSAVRAELEELRPDGRRLLLPDGRPVPDVRLVRGRHLNPGAVYAVHAVHAVPDQEDGKEAVRDPGAPAALAHPDASARITVKEWNRHRGVRLALAVTEDEFAVDLNAALKTLDRPELLELSGRARSEDVPLGLSRLRGRAALRLDDWWSAAHTGHTSPSVPLTARADHFLLRGEIRAAPRPAAGNGPRWEVRVIVTVRGRSLLRPLVAVVLRVTAGRLRRAVTGALDTAAGEWNRTVPRLVAMDADQLRNALRR